MLSYLHEFHAGNHADIIKHVTLLYVLEYMNKKAKPYTFFDSHGGAGLYSLDSEEAQKTGEATRGIQKLLELYEKSDSKFPESLENYISLVKKSLKNGFYPGSPIIEMIASLPESQIFIAELHKKEFKKLNSNISAFKQFSGSFGKEHFCVPSAKNVSGWDMLKSNVPPAIKRGAILCDPSYEELNDYHNAAKYLSECHKKWSGAIIMLWYPLLANKAEEIDSMKQQILSVVKNRDSHTEVLDAQLCIDTEDSHVETSLQESIGSLKPRLYGSGMFIINPCWNLDEHLKSALSFVSKNLTINGSNSVKMM